MTERASNRAMALRRLSNALQADERIAGTILVGSGAYGFADDESDIDLVAPVLAKHNPAAVFHDWKRHIETVLAVRYSAPTAFTEQHHLLVLLCAEGLEVDLSFPGIADLAATTPHWRILWARADDVGRRMTLPVQQQVIAEDRAYMWLLHRAIHRAVYTSKALRRGQTWKALVLLDELRSRVTQLACWATLGQPTTDALGPNGVERHIERLPDEVHRALAASVPSRVDAEALRGCVQTCVELVLLYARVLDHRYGIERAEPLSETLREHLSMG
jgi:predicted nucleotidyltransferase